MSRSAVHYFGPEQTQNIPAGIFEFSKNKLHMQAALVIIWGHANAHLDVWILTVCCLFNEILVEVMLNRNTNAWTRFNRLGIVIEDFSSWMGHWTWSIHVAGHKVDCQLDHLISHQWRISFVLHHWSSAQQISLLLLAGWAILGLFNWMVVMSKRWLIAGKSSDCHCQRLLVPTIRWHIDNETLCCNSHLRLEPSKD